MQRRPGVVDTPSMLTTLALPLLLAPTVLLAPTGAGLHFVDVGQGSALLVRGREGEVVLVDSGPPSGAEALLRALDEHELDRVDLWIHTHFDADHVGGFARVVAGNDGAWPSDDDVAVAQLWDRGDADLPDNDALALYLALAEDRRRAPSPGQHFEAAGLSLRVLELDPPPADVSENERGLALCLELEGTRVLIPGDLPAARVAEAALACGPVDLLWASHHGSASGLDAPTLAIVDPARVVIGAGPDNAYCHPAASTLALLHAHEVWLLDAAGVDPRGECPGLAETLGPRHTLVGGDLWITRDAVWLGMPGGGWSVWLSGA